MAQGATDGHLWDVTFEDVQVRAADGGGVYPYHRISRPLDSRVHLRLPVLLLGTVVDQRLHALRVLSVSPNLSATGRYPKEGVMWDTDSFTI